MTGLPQGVTLEQSAPAGSMTVRYGGRLLGRVGGHPRLLSPFCWTGTSVVRGETRHGFSGPDAAIRWVCLQARPVVYRVQKVTKGAARWEVIPHGATAGRAAFLSQTSAMHAADYAARRTLERAL